MNPRRATVLVVEDEAAIAETILYALQTEGFDTVWKTTGRDALSVLAATPAPTPPISLVVLDVGLPDGNGFDFCRELRRRSSVPVIFLTARSDPIDRIVGLELGADDYVPKPFSPRELTARVRAVLRRVGEGTPAPPATSSAASAPVVWNHDPARCQIAYRGQMLALTRNEYRLLATLLAAPGRVFSRNQLMELAWPDPGAATDRTVDAHVKLLRAKLREVAPDHDPIITHRGLGYSLREEP
ncbi:MAG TPA: two-component system response regulator CreB [Candidatus Synoicihabitans sp.]|nr:two-component system response regulator CreB [Candidatus Synoicihabitans sp.]